MGNDINLNENESGFSSMVLMGTIAVLLLLRSIEEPNVIVWI